MKRLVAILLVVLAVFAFTCSAEEIDLEAYTRDELIILSKKIDEILRPDKEDNDILLDPILLWVGEDIPAGKAEFILDAHYESGVTIFIDDENGENIDVLHLSSSRPKVRAQIEDGMSVQIGYGKYDTLEYGDVMLRILQD